MTAPTRCTKTPNCAFNAGHPGDCRTIRDALHALVDSYRTSIAWHLHALANRIASPRGKEPNNE